RARQVRLHREIAEAMEQVYGQRAGEHAAEIARHYHRSATLPGAERGVPYCLAAADEADRATAFADVAAHLRAAVDLVPVTAPERPRLLTRLGLGLVWDLRFEEARAGARGTAPLIAGAEGRDAAADYLAAMVAALNDAGAHDYQGATPLVREGLAYAGERRDTTWAILKALDIVDREIADPAGLGIPPDTPERREVGAILRFH